MAVKGFYYLMKNKQLRFNRIMPADGATRSWEFDEDETKVSALWRIAVEALALGADLDQVKRLLDLWSLDDSSGVVFARGLGVRVEEMDGTFLATFSKFPKGKPVQLKAGAGPSVVEALAELTGQGIYNPRNVG